MQPLLLAVLKPKGAFLHCEEEAHRIAIAVKAQPADLKPMRPKCVYVMMSSVSGTPWPNLRRLTFFPKADFRTLGNIQ
jgi:hypothetical protein